MITTKTSPVKRLIAICVLVAFTNAATGCHSSHCFLADERQEIQEAQSVYKIVTTNGRIFDFDRNPFGYATLRDTTVQVYLGNDSTEVIPLSSVETICTRGPDPKRTGIAVLLGVGVAALIAASFARAFSVGSH